MESHIRTTIESYDKTAQGYIERTDSSYRKESAEKFLSYIKKNSDSKKILDMGCSQGRDAGKFVEKGYDVVGIDLSKELIKVAKKRIPKAKFKIMDMRRLEFADETFDGIWASASFVHIPKKDILQTLIETKRVLKNKGIFYITVKIGEGEKLRKDERHENLEKYWVFFKDGEIQDYLIKSGFEIIEAIPKTSSNPNADYTWIMVYCRK